MAGRLASSEETSEAFRPKNVCGPEATGSIGNNTLVGTGRSRKLASDGVRIPRLRRREYVK
ncbi:MAG: hypothetical protein AB4062_08010 [Crocosphaera sp.]